MKRLISSILLVVFLLVCLPVTSVLADEWGGFTWSFKNNTLIIEGKGEVPAGGPWDNKCKNAKTLEIGEGITNIGNLSGFKALTSIVYHTDFANTLFSFQDSTKITEIRYTSESPLFEGSMYYYSRLKKITFENPNADYITEDNMLFNKDHTILFYYFDSGKGDVVVPEGIEIIASGAFANSKVKNITLPSTLTTIRSYAFYGCKQLKTITLPENMQYIGQSAFSASALSEISFLCPSIEFDVHYEANAFYSAWDQAGGWAFSGTNLKSISLPQCIGVPDGLFHYCKELKTVRFGDGSKTTYATITGPFEGCKKLESIFIPDSLNIDYNFLSKIPAKCKILCHKGSKAEEIAKLYNIKYEIVE